jgi:hypothetical protein
MSALETQDGYLVIALIATAFLAFTAYVTRLVVPVIVREVVPEVARGERRFALNYWQGWIL